MTPSNVRLVLGPPGTGKTTRLVQLLHDEIDAGVPTEAIAFVTFTRAARQEVRERVERCFRLSPDDLPWFRTIHSAAYRLLGLRPGDVLAAEAWAQFAGRFGYRLTTDQCSDVEADILAPPLVTADDALRALVQWSRNRRVSLDDALRQWRLHVPRSQAHVFAERLAAFRAEHALVDFPGMLERVLDEGHTPGGLVAFIDEAQDLSPLQIAVVESWFGAYARTYIAGDDDQAIYGFQGAEPKWLVSISQDCPTEILHRSFRIPSQVHRLAQEVVQQNRVRVPKRYEPRAEEGTVLVLGADAALSAVGDAESVFVLARNRVYLHAWASRLRDAGEPFVLEGAAGASSLGHPDVALAITSASHLRSGGVVSAEGLRAMLRFVPSRDSTLLPYGVKVRAERQRAPVARSELKAAWGLTRFLARLDETGPVHVLSRLRMKDRTYLERLLSRHGKVPAPRFRLMTIHASKGREADVVVLVPNMARTTHDEYVGGGRAGEEGENRVAYVAVTRARQRLILVEPTTRRAFPYQRFLLRAERVVAAGCPHFQRSSAPNRCLHALDGGLCALPGGFLCIARFGEARPSRIDPP